MATTLYSSTNFGASDYWSSSSNLIYNNLTYDSISRSGNTVTVYGLSYWFTTRYTSYAVGYVYHFPVTVTINGSSVSGEITIPASGSWTQQGPISLGDLSFTAAAADTSATVTLANENGSASTASISFSAGYVAPTTPTVSVSVSGTTAIVSYGTTSFGTPSSGTVTLYGGASSSPTTSLDTTTTTGDKIFFHTGLTPGTTYYYRARATNGQLNSSYSTTVSVTIPVRGALGLYGSANTQTRKVTALYGSTSSETTPIQKLYGSVQSEIYSAHPYRVVTAINGYKLCAAVRAATSDYASARRWQVTVVTSSKYKLQIYTDSSMTNEIFNVTASASVMASDYGVTVDESYGGGSAFSSLTYTTQSVSRLLYQGFGHISYN